jgi:hypothetical protein
LSEVHVLICPGCFSVFALTPGIGWGLFKSGCSPDSLEVNETKELEGVYVVLSSVSASFLDVLGFLSFDLGFTGGIGLV